jgi:hypothetical protein
VPTFASGCERAYLRISNLGAPKFMSKPCSMRAARKYPQYLSYVLVSQRADSF